MSPNITIKNYLKKIVENIYFISFCTLFLFLLFVSFISYYKQINNSSYLEFTIKYPSNFSTNFQNKNKFEKFKLENNIDLQFSELFFYQGSQLLNEKLKRLEKKIYTLKNPKQNNQSAKENFDKVVSIYKDTFSIKIFPSSKNIEKYKSDVINYINYIYDEECKIMLDIKSEIKKNEYFFDDEIELVYKKNNQQSKFMGFENFKNYNYYFPEPNLTKEKTSDEYKNNKEVISVLEEFLFVLNKVNYRVIDDVEEIKSFFQKNENIINKKYGNYNFANAFKKNYLDMLEEIKYINENNTKLKNDYWFFLKHQLIEEFKYEYTKYLVNFAKEISEDNFKKIFDEKKKYFQQNDFTKSEMLNLNLYWIDILTESLVITTKYKIKELIKRNNSIKFFRDKNKLAVQSFYTNYCHNEIFFVTKGRDINKNFGKQNNNLIIYLFCFIISFCVVLIFFNIKTYNKK